MRLMNGFDKCHLLFLHLLPSLFKAFLPVVPNFSNLHHSPGVVAPFLIQISSQIWTGILVSSLPSTMVVLPLPVWGLLHLVLIIHLNNSSEHTDRSLLCRVWTANLLLTPVSCLRMSSHQSSQDNQGNGPVPVYRPSGRVEGIFSNLHGVRTSPPQLNIRPLINRGPNSASSSTSPSSGSSSSTRPPYSGNSGDDTHSYNPSLAGLHIY